MKFKSLHLNSFGKFNNKRLKFTDGLNFIHGENESGKSTTESAIYGLFYGFSKDSTKRRLYDEKFQKYKPLLNTEYRSSIEFVDIDTIRIERDFREENLKVYNLDESKDITKDSEFVKFSRIKQPGAKFFGLSSSIYRSTFFIESDSVFLASNFRSDLRDLIVEVSSTMDMTRSTSAALKELDQRIKALGEEKIKSSNIGQLQEKIEGLLQEKLNLKIKSSRYDEILEELEELNRKKNELLKKLEIAKLSSEYKAYTEITRLKGEIERIGGLSKLDIKRYEALLDINENLKYVFSKIDEVNRELKQEKVDTLTNTVKRDYKNFRKKINRLKELNQRNYSREITSLSHDIENLKTKNKFLYIILFFIGLFSISDLVLSVFFKFYYPIILLIPLMIYFFLRVVKVRVNNSVIHSLQLRSDELKRFSQDKKLEKKEMDIFFAALSTKYQVESKDLDEKLHSLMRAESINEYKTHLRKEKHDKNILKLEELTKKRDELQNKLEEQLSLEGVKNLDELREKFKNSATEESVNRRIGELERAIEFQLKGRDFESLNRDEVNCDFDINRVKKDSRDVEIEISKLEIALQNLDVNLNRAQEVETELHDLNLKKEALNFEKEALNLTKNTILSVMKENKNKSLPEIIECTSYYFKIITDNEYEYVMIDEDLNLTVKKKNPAIMMVENILSEGTISELYLSFRLALMDVITEKNIPIVMDDVLLNFDDKRAKLAMKLFKEISKNRQILYFSSSTRDLRNAEELSSNILRLSQ